MSSPLPGRVLPPAPGTFRALRNRDYRLLWCGQLVSLTGSWMQSVAQGWLVLRLTDSPFQLGVVGFCSYAPVLVFALAAGAVADRVPRRAALVCTQLTATAVALTLGILTGLGVIRVWHVALLALGQGTAAAFDIPVRQALLQDLVGREDLQNAIALNSTAFNGARMVGPALAGLLLPLVGEATLFLLNAASYGAVITGLMMMRSAGRPEAPSGGSWTAAIRSGVAYAARSRRVRALLVLVATSSVFGLSYTVLMPVFARDVLGAGSRGLGLLMGAAGLGATTGALYLAGRTSSRGSGRLVAGALASFGASLIVLGLSRSFALSLAAVTVAGAAMIVQMATSNTLLQLSAPSEMRGRIVSLYMLSFIGTAPFGALLAGWVADAFGAPWAAAGGGVVCLGAAGLFALRIPALRRAE
jgi:MFS family permease